ncbi:hypothetical protein HNP25_002397 [Arcicella rosea]|uniref:Uncharacterized protein n=1 Tax=Arcicella rosea TaxID=502909 RepID=A0A841ESU1_9BACT|nr:hypothetical protein [Arcicella rosea]MBB6003738.1 hypothetical protein [Arcicella rosea]
MCSPASPLKLTKPEGFPSIKILTLSLPRNFTPPMLLRISDAEPPAFDKSFPR